MKKYSMYTFAVAMLAGMILTAAPLRRRFREVLPTTDRN